MPRIDAAELVRLYRRELPRPADVLNRFDQRDNAHYDRYARLVAPTMRLVGARVLWTGRRESVLHGPQPPAQLLITRYPSHRRCLLVVINPLYLLLNRVRAAGISSYEAGFMSAHTDEVDLGRRLLVVAHDGDAQAIEALDGLSARLGVARYGAGETGSFSFVRDPGPTDTSPPRHPVITCFALPDGEPGQDAALERLPADASAAVFTAHEYAGYARLRTQPARRG